MDQMKNMSLADSLKNPHKNMKQTIQGENFILKKDIKIVESHEDLIQKEITTPC